MDQIDPVAVAERKRRLWCISDELWARLAPSFPERKGRKGFAEKIPARTILEAVLFRARTGGPWRDLPVEYGDNHTIYVRWNRWCKAGRPQAAMAHLQAEQTLAGELDLSLVFLDSTVVRAHQHAAGARKESGPQALGRSRGGFSTKVHVAAADEAHALGVMLTPGQSGDAPVGEVFAHELGGMEAVQAVGGDKGYDSDTIREILRRAKKQRVIPPRATRTKRLRCPKAKYRQRNKVERLFGRLKQFRAVATRYEKLACMYLGVVTVCLLTISVR